MSRGVVWGTPCGICIEQGITIFEKVSRTEFFVKIGYLVPKYLYFGKRRHAVHRLDENCGPSKVFFVYLTIFEKVSRIKFFG